MYGAEESQIVMLCGYILLYNVKDLCVSLARSVLCPISPEDGEMQRIS